jgi:Spy/CpxP family protein refolding chaperone
MMMRSWLVWLILALTVGVAAAQPAPGPAPRVGPQTDRREEVKKKIRAMRAYTLTEELALDEKTAAKLFPVLARWDDVTDKLLQQRVDIMRRVAAAGGAAGADPKVLDKLIDEAVANQKGFWDLEEKRLAELRKILTPAQTAKLIVVLPAFERKIQNQLRRAMRRGAAAGARGMDRPVDRSMRPGGTLDDDDDDFDDDDFEEPAPRRRRIDR